VARLPPLALLVVGLLLVANPVWLAPGAGEPRYTYRAYDVETTDFDSGNWTAVRRDPEVLDCGVTGRPAACEPYLRATEGPTATVGEPRYEYLYVAESGPDSRAVDERYYRVEATSVNGTTGLRLETVPRERVRETVATECHALADSAPIRRAVETSEVVTRHRLTPVESAPDGQLLVAHEGSVFLVTATKVDQPREGTLLGGGTSTAAFRGALLVTGLAVAVRGWRRRGR
jgi:hypothetical protein